MNQADPQKWQLMNSHDIVNDRWLRLRANTYTTPDGHEISPYYVSEFPDWVNCFVIDENDDVLMVNHYRPAVHKYLPELVGGCIEEHDDSPEAGMRRELAEELGYTGGTIKQTSVSHPNAASHTNTLYTFIAFGGSCTKSQDLEIGESLEILRIPYKNFKKWFVEAQQKHTFQSMHLLCILHALDLYPAIIATKPKQRETNGHSK